eukprot:TRINITY_DN60698_c0_g1_i1.p1 TRINITY_DN60698_c0_g1~~TRINITY_DN60698_c0_g1_i1.p1  ORF type:complete len:584 (+),score=228.97 TRINITY_DN60698_c0_g1_i1:80-1753(+)
MEGPAGSTAGASPAPLREYPSPAQPHDAAAGSPSPAARYSKLHAQSTALTLIEDLDRDRREAYGAIGVLEGELEQRALDNSALQTYLRKEIEETQRLEGDLGGTREQLDERTSELNQLKDRVVKLTGRLETAEGEAVRQRGRAEAAERDARQSGARAAQLASRLEQAESALGGELRVRDAELQELVGRFKEEGRAVRRTVKALDQEKAQQQELVRELEQRLRQSQEDAARLEELAAERERQRQAAAERAEAEAARADAAERECAELRDRGWGKPHGEVPTLRALCDKLQSTVALQADQLKDLHVQLREAHGQLAAAHEEGRRLKEEIERLRVERAAQIAAADRHAEEVEARTAARAHGDYSAALQVRDAEMDALRSQLESDRVRREGEREDAGRRLGEVQRELAEAALHHQQREAELSAALAAERQRAGGLQDTIEAQQRELAEERERCAELRAAAEEAAGWIASAQEREQGLEAAVAERDSRLAKACRALRELEEVEGRHIALLRCLSGFPEQYRVLADAALASVPPLAPLPPPPPPPLPPGPAGAGRHSSPRRRT